MPQTLWVGDPTHLDLFVYMVAMACSKCIGLLYASPRRISITMKKNDFFLKGDARL